MANFAMAPILPAILGIYQAQEDIRNTQAKTSLLGLQAQLIGQQAQSEQQFQQSVAKLADTQQVTGEVASTGLGALSTLGNSEMAKPIIQGYQSSSQAAAQARKLAVTAASAGLFDKQKQFEQEAEGADNRARQWYQDGLKLVDDQHRQLASVAGSYEDDGSNVNEIVDGVRSIDPRKVMGAQFDRDPNTGQIVAGPKTAKAFETLANTSMTRSEQLRAKQEADRLKQEAANNARNDENQRLRELAEDRRSRAQQHGMEVMDRRLAIAEGKAAGGKDTGDDFSARFDKMSQNEKEKLDIQSWAYIDKGILPYRRGAGGGNDKNELMYQNTARIARDLDMTPQELVAQSAEFKSTAMSLQQVTKDLSAIGPFKEMLDKNISIAKGLADKAIATDSKLANKSINWLRQNASDNPTVSTYLAQIQIVQTEAARVLNNPRLVGQLTDTARKEMEGVVNGEMPLNSAKAVLDRLQGDGTNRVNAMEKKEASLRRKLEGKKDDDIKTVPNVNAKGWTLHTDKNNNRAYVSPDGKQYEEVK